MSAASAPVLALLAFAGLGCGPPASSPASSGPDSRAPAPPAPDSAAPSFATRIEWPAYGRPDGVASGDLDGDGRPELVVTTLSPSALVLWWGSEEGLNERPVRVEVPDYPLAPIVVEGAAPRVATACRATSELLIHDPHTLGESAAETRVPLRAKPRALTSGDLNDDGQEEIVVATDAGLEGFAGGARSFEAAVALGRATCLLVSSDGQLVVVGDQAHLRLLVFAVRELLDGSARATQVDLGGIPRHLAQSDIDGDGDVELLVAGGDDRLWILGGDASGGPSAWRAGAIEERATSGAIPVFVGAFASGPQRADAGLATVHASGLTWTAMDAASGVARATGYCGQTPTGATLGDFDADGITDLVVANRDGACLSFFRGVGGAFERPGKVRVGTGALSVAAADVDGDGAPDAVAATVGDPRIVVCANRDGRLEVERALPVVGSPQAVRLGHLGGDARLDGAFLVQGRAGARIELLRNRAQSGPTLDALADSRPGGTAGDLLIAGLGEGAWAELLATDADSDRVQWWRGVDEGEGKAISLPQRPRPVALAAGDFDGDTTLELLVACSTNGTQLRALRTPWDAGDVLFEHALDGVPVQVLAADLDGDGTHEVVVLTRRPPPARQGSLHVLRFADGRLQPIAAGATGLDPRRALATDVDGDGWSELFVANRGSHDVSCLRVVAGPDGAWALQRLPDLGADLGPMDLAAADFDGDGRVDLLVANAFSEALSVLYGREPSEPNASEPDASEPGR